MAMLSSALFNISPHSMSPSTSTGSFPDSRILPPINTSNLTNTSRSYSYQTRPSQPMPTPADNFPFSALPPMEVYCSPAHSNSSSITLSGTATPAPIEQTSFKQQQQDQGQGLPRRSTRSSTCKKPSISSLLSTPDSLSSPESSGVSSPSMQWSAASSPATTASGGGTRSSSVATTPLSAYNNGGYGSDFGMLRRTSSISGISSPICEVESMNAVAAQHKSDSENANGGKRKARSSPRTGGNGNGNADEYDVLGRKKPKTPRTPMSWDPQDDILLKQLKEEQRLGWKEIATHFSGRTSHACQFRWRRLASGTLKYYQGHRRPPVITTTSSSFANEMASTASTCTVSASPKVLVRSMNNLSPAPSANPTTPQLHHNAIPQFSPLMTDVSPIRSAHHSGFYPPTPWSAPVPYQMAALYHHAAATSPLISPRYLMDSRPAIREPWQQCEDALLLDKKRSFDEVNVLLPKRTEEEIWDRMAKLRSQVGLESLRRRNTDDMRATVRRNSVWSG